jgi:hypothetical protein
MRNSLQAQVTPHLNRRAGNRWTLADAISLDMFRALVGSRPSLVKIDAEGSEPAVLRGAAHLLASSEPPAILFEFNPITLAECDENIDTLAARLTGYILYYVDYLRGQMLPFGEMVENLRMITWICNLFAVPRADAAVRCWTAVSGQVRQRLAMPPT